MERILAFIGKAYFKFLAYFPTKLPQGLTEFTEWSNELIALYGMPNNDSTHFALAVMVMHLKPTESYKPKVYFGRCLEKGAANEVAGYVMQQLKEKQKEQQARAAAESKAAAVTLDGPR